MKITKNHKIALSVGCFAMSGFMFAKMFIGSTQQIGPRASVAELGVPNPGEKPNYLIMKQRLESRIERRRKSGKPVDPQVLKELETLRTVYLGEAPSKDPEVLAAMKLAVKGPSLPIPGQPKVPQVPAPPNTAAAPSKVPADKAAAAGKTPASPSAVPSKVPDSTAQVTIQTPEPIKEKEVAGDNAPKIATGPAVVIEKTEEEQAGEAAAADVKASTPNRLQGKTQYLTHSIPPWSHSWQYTANADYARRHTFTVMATLWHRNRIVGQKVLFEKVGSTIASTDTTDLQITFRTKEGLVDMNGSDGKLLFDAYSNKDPERVRKFYIKLSQMNAAKFIYKSSSTDFVDASAPFLEAYGKAPSTAVLKIRFFITDSTENKAIAH